MPIQISGLTRIATTLVAALSLAAAPSGQSNSPGQRYTAVAIDLDRGSATPLDIVVERWSSDSTRDRLMSVLLNQGADKLLDALRDAPVVGHVKRPGNLSWDLHFARRTPGEDGGERVVIATDRPISVWEAAVQPRSIDYPFTVIEMRLNAGGEGTGSLSIATKIIPDKEGNIITLENFGTQRVRLTEVKTEKLNN
jgi:hypothetical protein